MNKFALVKDLFFKAKIQETARHAGQEIIFVDEPQKAQGADVLFVDLEVFGVNWVKDFHERNPRAKLVGYLSHANIALKKDAGAAGFNLVLARSEFVKTLFELLK